MNLQNSDLHIHTRVSDGTSDAIEMLKAASDAGLKRMSITDHDAVGAYRHYHENLFSLAHDMGIELIPGIELDCEYKNIEVHLLGYQIDTGNASLAAHLRKVQNDRRQRITRQIMAINHQLEETVLTKEEVLLPDRDSLMKPHLVHGLLRTGRWGNDYKAAQSWLNETIKSSVKVFKPAIEDAIALVHGAGGHAVLAHPGFLSMEQGLPLDQTLRDLKEAGLDGVEIEYPYTGTSKFFSDEATEAALIAELRILSRRFSLFPTRGSDAHEPAKIREFALRRFS